jgi:hypothetical protein
MEIWRRDVNERETPALGTSCVGNCFAFSEQHWPLIEQYRTRVLENLRRHFSGDPAIGRAYRFSHGNGVSDELTLSSLLNFSRHAPQIAHYALDEDPAALLIHLSLRPKPWEAWRERAMKYYELIVSTVEWVERNGYRTPEVPWQFRRRNEWAARLHCGAWSAAQSARASISRGIGARRRAKGEKGRA